MAEAEAINRGIQQRLEGDPELRAAILETLFEMNAGYFDRSEIDVVVQVGQRNRSYKIEDAFIFHSVRGWLLTGDLVGCLIGVEATPLADAKEAENNALLANLPKPFSAVFAGGAGEFDGHVAWSEPLTINRATKAGVEPYEFPAGEASLEVGYTRSQTTMLHFLQQGRLARWPYESDCIWLYMLTAEKRREVCGAAGRMLLRGTS